MIRTNGMTQIEHPKIKKRKLRKKFLMLFCGVALEYS